MKNVLAPILIGLLLISSPGITGNLQPHFDPAYTGNFTNLFDQSLLVDDIDFQKATETEKQKRLVSEFETRKSQQYYEVLKSYFPLSVVVLVATTAKIIYSRTGAAQNPAAAPGGGLIPQNGIGIMGLILATLLQPISYTVTTPLMSELERLSSALSRYSAYQLRKVTSYFSGEIQKMSFSDDLEQSEYLWVVSKRNVSKTLWAPVEASIAKVRSPISSAVGPVRRVPDIPLLIQRALALPNNVKELDFDPKRIEEEFRGYDLDFPDALYEFCFRFVSASKSGSPISKIPLYFHGPAGVGKSEAARKLARVLDASVEEVSLEKVTHINDIFGWPKDHEKAGPGLLAEAMIKANREGKGSKNMLIVFDEAGGTINRNLDIATAFKKKLEPSVESYENLYFDAEISISHVGFIFLDNTTLKDTALANRMQPIHFRGFVPAYKSEVVLTRFLPELLAKEFSNPSFGKVVIDEKVDKPIIEQMIASDSDPGFRTIFLNVRRYLEHKALGTIFNRTLGEFKPVKNVE